MKNYKIIVVYDISSSNFASQKIRNLLSLYFVKPQLSVWEGECDKGDLIKIEKEINNIIDKKLDSVIIFYFDIFKKNFNKQIFGVVKNIEQESMVI